MNELVTVCMLSYNHGDWVGKALDGIVKQKTNFKFCAIVHDDASTDNSQNVIKEYAENYPDLIYPILQKENKYSQGIKVTATYVFPKVNSKYVAFCECDDFWIDETKLQKQIDYMEKHPECTFCFSNGYIVDINSKLLTNFLPSKLWNDREINKKLNSNTEVDFNVNEMLLLDFIPTASTVMRYDSLKKQIDVFHSTLDLINRIYCTSRGYAHYFPDKFVAYRTGNKNSASGKAFSSFENAINDHFDCHKKWYDEFDSLTNKLYHKNIEKVKNRKLLQLYISFGKYKEAKAMESYNDLLASRKIKICLKYRFGFFYKIVRNLIQKLRRIKGGKELE